MHPLIHPTWDDNDNDVDYEDDVDDVDHVDNVDDVDGEDVQHLIQLLQKLPPLHLPFPDNGAFPLLNISSALITTSDATSRTFAITDFKMVYFSFLSGTSLFILLFSGHKHGLWSARSGSSGENKIWSFEKHRGWESRDQVIFIIVPFILILKFSLQIV